MIVDKAISTLKFSLVCSCNLESAQMIQCGGEAIPAFVYPMLGGGQHAG